MDKVVLLPPYRVRRRAPREFVNKYPQLWRRMAPSRYAWLQVAWLFAGSALVLLLSANWPAVVGYVALWFWQRHSPTLWVCRLVELGLFCAFAVMLLQAHILIKYLPTSPFAVIALFGIPPLLYEASGRSWHGLFNALADSSREFAGVALGRGWLVEPVARPSQPQRIWPVAVTVLMLALTLAVLAYGVALDYLGVAWQAG